MLITYFISLLIIANYLFGIKWFLKQGFHFEHDYKWQLCFVMIYILLDGPGVNNEN